MKTLLESDLDFLKVEKMGQTIQERPLELLTVTDPINLDPVSRFSGNFNQLSYLSLLSSS